MKKKAKPLLILGAVVLILLALLARWSRSKTLDLSGVDCDPDRYAYGSSAGYNVSVGDVGLFYTKEMGEQIRFYDLEAKQSYVLCSRANCTHMTSKCPAYFALNIMGSAAENVAQVGSYIYCTYLANAANGQQLMDENGGAAYQLIRIDPADGSRKVIASFPAVHNAADGDEVFFASGIGRVEYCGGWAWFDLYMKQQDQNNIQGASYSQLTGVNLETGQVVALNQYESQCNGCICAFSTITSDTVYFCRTWNTVPLMTEQEFSDAISRSDSLSIVIEDQKFENYHKYWAWHVNYYPDQYEIAAYTVPTGKTQILFSGETAPVGYANQLEGGIFYMQRVPYDVFGSFDGKAVCMEFVADSNGNYFESSSSYFLLNPQTGARENLPVLDNCGILAIAQGFHPNLIFPDGTLLYMNYHEDKADIYSLDLNTGESTFLFTDDEAITFRIFGEYKDGFFCKHKDHQDDMRFYWISKEDFYAGNLDAAIMYQL